MNIYHNPEKYGVEVVGEIDWTDDTFSFDLTVVWKDPKNVLYWDSDAGCSCPTPFENIQSIAQLQTGSIIQLSHYLREYEHDVRDVSDHVHNRILDLITKVRSLPNVKQF